MTVEQGDVVDAVGVEKETGLVVLTVSDHLGWEDEAEHLRALREKLNSYLMFIETGQLIENYPEATGRLPRIDVIFRVPPSPSALEFMSNAKETMRHSRIAFSWRVMSDAS